MFIVYLFLSDAFLSDHKPFNGIYTFIINEEFSVNKIIIIKENPWNPNWK